MESLNIRRAKPEETGIVRDLNKDLFTSDKDRDKFLNHNWPQEEGQAYYLKRINDSNHLCLVADLNGDIVGYLAGAIREVESWRPVKRTELENMFVKEEFRSQGIGARLVQEFLKWSKEKGVERALVVAYATNNGAIRFYQKMGFNPESISLETKI